MARYIVYGAGAIGSIFGAQLSLRGKEVVLIGRPAHVEAICREGLELKSKGLFHRVRVNAKSDLSEIRPRDDDRILVTVKTQQTEAAVEQLTQVFPRNTPVISFQNAVRNEKFLSCSFDRVYGGLVDFSGNFLKPGCVEHTRNDLLALGNFPDGFDSLAENIAGDLEQAGFRVERSGDIMAIKWWKLILNTNNALLAILDCWLQKSVSDPEIYPLTADVLAESFNVVKQAGIRPRPPQGIPSLETAIQKMRSGKMACLYDLPFDERTYPSTWQDLQLRRGETEAHYLNGEIEQLGRKLGVPTPLNSTLLRLVNKMSSKKELPGKYTPLGIKRIFDKNRCSE
jgi:2-dehydropantoate 2-reductase